MFEVGREYEFRVIEGGEETLFWRTVTRYEHPLITVGPVAARHALVIDLGGGDVTRLEGIPGDEQIINVTSPNFISAKVQG